MIYPDVTVEEWSKRWGFKSYSMACISCGAVVKADKPYRSKDYVGLESNPCKCGCTRSRCSFSIPISKKEQQEWADIIGFYIGKSEDDV